jgi:hypothetical protein
VPGACTFVLLHKQFWRTSLTRVIELIIQGITHTGVEKVCAVDETKVCYSHLLQLTFCSHSHLSSFHGRKIVTRFNILVVTHVFVLICLGKAEM